MKYIVTNLERGVEDRLMHLTVFSPEYKEEFVEIILYLEVTPIQARRALFNSADEKEINHSWNTEDMLPETDWFRAFLRRYSNFSLRNSERRSRTRAQGLCKEVTQYF